MASSKAVQIADDAEEFVAACEQALALSRDPKATGWPRSTSSSPTSSWDTTFARMAGLIAELLGAAPRPSPGAAVAAAWRSAPARAGSRYDYLIVGAGFAGSVLAERLASQHGARVLVVDRRAAHRRQRL